MDSTLQGAFRIQTNCESSRADQRLNPVGKIVFMICWTESPEQKRMTQQMLFVRAMKCFLLQSKPQDRRVLERIKGIVEKKYKLRKALIQNKSVLFFWWT